MRMQNIFFCLGASCWSGHFTRSIFLFFLTRQFPGARSILFFFSLLAAAPLDSLCAPNFFFLAVHAEALLLFPCAVTFLRRVQFFVFLCLLPVSRTAGQPVRARFFYFLFFFLSLHARAEYFFSVASCLRATFSVWSAGVCMQIFFWVCMQSPVTSPLLGAAQFFFGHLCSVRSLLTAEQTCQGAMHIFFLASLNCSVRSLFVLVTSRCHPRSKENIFFVSSVQKCEGCRARSAVLFLLPSGLICTDTRSQPFQLYFCKIFTVSFGM